MRNAIVCFVFLAGCSGDHPVAPLPKVSVQPDQVSEVDRILDSFAASPSAFQFAELRPRHTPRRFVCDNIRDSGVSAVIDADEGGSRVAVVTIRGVSKGEHAANVVWHFSRVVDEIAPPADGIGFGRLQAAIDDAGRFRGIFPIDVNDWRVSVHESEAGREIDVRRLTRPNVSRETR